MAENFYYHPDTDLKSIALAAGPSGIVLAGWWRANAQLLSGSTLTETAVSGVGGLGFVAAMLGTTGVWMPQITGNLVVLRADGTVATRATDPGSIYTGGCIVSGAPYIVNSVGAVSAYVSGAVTAVSPSPAFSGTAPARQLGLVGSTLYSLMPGASGVGSFALSSAISGTSGFVATPMTVPACLAASGQLAVGGWNFTSIASGYSSLAMDLGTSLQLLGVNPTAGRLDNYAGAGSGIWALSQSLSGLGNPSSITWAPTYLFAFALDPTAGNVRIFSNTFSMLASSQTLPVASAATLAITSDSASGLICCTAANLLTSLSYNGSTWSSGATLALAAPQCALTLSATQIMVGFASGVALYNVVAGSWTQTVSAATAFLPKAFQQDAQGNIYAIGIAGGSGYLTALTSAGVSDAYTTWTGGADGLLCQQGQFAVLDTAANLIRMYGIVAGAFTAQPTIPAPTAPAAMTSNLYDVFVAGSGATWQYSFDAPYTLARQKSGMVSIYVSGTTWNSLALGVTGIPTALTWDPSGNVTVVSAQNQIFTVSPTGGLNSSSVIGQAAGQYAGVSLGLSALCWSGGKLYASSILNDSLLEIV